MRIGLGVDFHPFSKEKDLFLGGVKIDYHLGLDGHSDADVLTHAICDALLGAAGLEDIGRHFPDDDSRWKDISSLKILKEVMGMIASRGFKIVNIDAAVIADQPQIGIYYRKIRDSLAKTIGLEVEKISIKAKRSEGLGLIGAGKGMASIATALLEES